MIIAEQIKEFFYILDEKHGVIVGVMWGSIIIESKMLYRK